MTSLGGVLFNKSVCEFHNGGEDSNLVTNRKISTVSKQSFSTQVLNDCSDEDENDEIGQQVRCNNIKNKSCWETFVSFILRHWSIFAALVVGQTISWVQVVTNTSSQKLSDNGVDLPQLQGLLTYALLGLIFTPIYLIRHVFDEKKQALFANRSYRQWVKKCFSYLILAAIDVEANFMIVKAFQYTNLISVQILDNFVIPAVLVLNLIFLRKRFTFFHYFGALLSVAGVLAMVVSNAIIYKNGEDGGNQELVGDLLVLGAALCYAISNVAQEFLLKGDTTVDEWLCYLGVFGTLVGGIQFAIIEGTGAVNEVDWTGDDNFNLKWMAVFAVGLTVFYCLVPVMVSLSSSTIFNISITTSDFYSAIISKVVFGQVFNAIYILSFCMSVGGVMIYLLLTDKNVAVITKPFNDRLRGKPKKSSNEVDLEFNLEENSK